MHEYIDLLKKNANYRNLWLGSVVSQLGDWFNLIASAELITSLTDSGVAVSSLFLARFLPLFLFSPIAGVLADRYSRKAIMIVADILRAATVISFLLIRSPDQLWMLYALTTLQFILSALFTPARSAVLANVVPKKDLVPANALDSLTWSTMLALGAFLGGVVAALFGARIAFIADAGTFLLSAFFIGRIMIKVPLETAKVEHNGFLDFVDGFRYLWSRPFIRVIALVKAGGSLVWGAINVLEINFANEIFPLDQIIDGGGINVSDGGTATLGIIYVVSGIGTGLGPILVRKGLGDKLPRLMIGITLGFGLLAFGIGLLSVSQSLGVYLLATLIRTVGSGTIWVFSAAFLQMIVPDRFRGRVFAFEFAMLTLTQSISVFAGGYMQDVLDLSVRQTTAVIGLVGVGVLIIWLLFHIQQRETVRTTMLQIESAD